MWGMSLESNFLPKKKCCFSPRALSPFYGPSPHEKQLSSHHEHPGTGFCAQFIYFQILPHTFGFLSLLLLLWADFLKAQP